MEIIIAVVFGIFLTVIALQITEFLKQSLKDQPIQRIAKMDGYYTFQDLDESDKEFAERVKRERERPKKRAVKTGNYFTLPNPFDDSED